MSREIDQRVVAKFSRDNTPLAHGGFVTKQDVDSEIEALSDWDFESGGFKRRSCRMTARMSEFLAYFKK